MMLKSLAVLFGLKPKPPAKRATDEPPADPYHAVSIIPGAHACAAAYRFTGQRFLSRQAPRLPLPTCDAFVCNCRFKHHQDRRAGPRRRSDIGLMSPWSAAERRTSTGRRAGDKPT